MRFSPPPDELDASVSGFAMRGVRGHLLQVIEPTEEMLPFAGRVRFEDFERNPLELGNCRATGAKLAPDVEASGGAIFWMGNGNLPEVRRVAPGRLAACHGWLGLRENGDYVVTGGSEEPLLPGVLTLFLALGLFAACPQEGR